MVALTSTPSMTLSYVPLLKHSGAHILRRLYTTRINLPHALMGESASTRVHK